MSAQPCLVFAHYFGGSARSWAPLASALERKFELVLRDLPGFGRTPPPTGVPSLDGYANWFATLAPSRPWIAVGHSMGGKIALAAAVRRPADLVAIILIAPSPPTPEPMTPVDRRKTLAAFGDDLAAREHFAAITQSRLAPVIFEACVEDELDVDQTVWNWWLERGSRDDISAQTSALTLPVFVLTGDNDTVLGPDTASEVTAGLRAAQLQIVPGAGHLVPLEQPRAVADAIRSFVDQLAGAR